MAAFPDHRIDKALNELIEPLRDLGDRWAQSVNRPRPSKNALNKWDRLLKLWVGKKDLPLLMRKSGRRGEADICSNGRKVLFTDNSPANWALGLALNGTVPSIGSWSETDVRSNVPFEFTKKQGFKLIDLNKAGWKICHIEPVSDRRRRKIGDIPPEEIETAFLRFLSPANMFLIPKEISGAGEIQEVINAVRDFDERAHFRRSQGRV